MRTGFVLELLELASEVFAVRLERVVFAAEPLLVLLDD